jgi:SNF2 family DNA or RNA helicase
MAFSFRSVPSAKTITVGVEERRLLGKRSVPVAEWNALPEHFGSAARHVLSLVENGGATATETHVTISNDDVLELPAGILTTLGLPPAAAVVLRLDLTGRIDSPDGRIKLSWEDAFTRTINPRIEGTIASGGRLSKQTYRILRAVADYNATAGLASRIDAWVPVQKELEALVGTEVRPDRLLTSLRIHQAGAFSLDVRESIDGPVFDPVLMAPGSRVNPLDDQPSASEDDVNGEVSDEASQLLKAADNQEFLKSFSSDGLQTRPAYVIGRNTYVVVDADTRAALDVVKRMQRSGPAERRAFVRNPRSFLVQALPELGEAAGRIFVETSHYSERVKGLGLWEKPNLSWLARKSAGWLPEGFVITVGNKAVAIDEAGLVELAEKADEAADQGRQDVEFRDERYTLTDVKEALNELRLEFSEEAAAFKHEHPDQEKPERDLNVLLIDDHIEDASSQESRARRMELPQLFPSDLVRTEPKRHQQEGFKWLVMGWKWGFPGVLLADDMGLGKTLQALSFLVWFRANRNEVRTSLGDIAGPILIVAPTALLRNWQKEAATHLRDDPLGHCVEAFGPGLRRLKQSNNASLDDALDIQALKDADWILTTYETLANYHRVFARVRFSVVLFDEMQKIKAPDTINTHAAKTLNAGFVIGLTGTPIENRIEDLWCIMDRVAPGYLGGLKAFSKTYGGEDHTRLAELKNKLDQPDGKRPPIVLRRMKLDHIDGLPQRTFQSRPATMPVPQAQAYDAVVKYGQQQRGNKSAMLKIIHDLRGISLHPHGRSEIDPQDVHQRRDWIAASARVAETFEVLRMIEKKGEKALVFIEDRAVQSTFAQVVAEEFRLPSLPQIINGELDGDRRQAAVDRFQAAKPGFGLMILSPKAAGIGLTITAANHVIHLSRWWNPAVEDQCNDRVFRIGQDKPVTVHIPIARHPVFGDASFDVKLDALLERKRTLSRDMLMPPVWDTDIDQLFAETIG